MKKIYTICLCLLLTLGLALPAEAAPGYETIGNATVNDVGASAMTPIYGKEIPDGSYTIKVKSSSSFFKIEKAELTVKDGEMTAVLTMYSESYTYLYPGTSEAAAAAPLSDYIPLEEVDDYPTFTFPVTALNSPIDCAAFSKKKEKWYYRQLVFLASSLPEGTLSYELPDYDLINDALAEYEENHPEKFASEEAVEGENTGAEGAEPCAMEEADGEYSIKVDLSGGSGRASVTSPTWLYVKDGKAYAKLLWSSTYYDYMIVGGETYLNETTDGSNSTFTIPITALDEPMTVIADTTAMGDQVEIEYDLTFYGDSIGSKNSVPQEGAKLVVAIALFLMIGGGIANHIIKSRRKQ